MTFPATISQGKLSLSNRKRFETEIASMPDGQYEILVRLKNRRTDPQNRYYWACVVWEIRNRLEELGHRTTSEQVHDLLKAKFLAIPITNEQGEVEYMPGASSGLNKAEFSQYLEQVTQWAAEFLGIEIPTPDTELKMFGD